VTLRFNDKEALRYGRCQSPVTPLELAGSARRRDIVPKRPHSLVEWDARCLFKYPPKGVVHLLSSAAVTDRRPKTRAYGRVRAAVPLDNSFEAPARDRGMLCDPFTTRPPGAHAPLLFVGTGI